MKKKILINNGRIDGLGMLQHKFPSLTSRQSCQAYEIASKQGLSLEEIKSVAMTNPSADIGERFGITFNLNL